MVARRSSDPLLDLKLSRLSRRHLLKTFGAAGAASFLLPAAVREALAQPIFTDFPFQLGVASGDPAPDGFVIWTKLMPRPLDIAGNYGMPRQPVEVQWEVAKDDRFRDIVQNGTAVAHPDLGHSVHVELTGLEPGRPYWYRFQAGRERSFVGRARTLPAPGSTPEKVRFGVAGCQAYEQGHYTAYKHLAQEDLDFVYCYGDYIYEYRGRDVFADWTTGAITRTVRRSSGDEIHTIDDYRRRYAEYKMDVNLMTAHANHPWFVTWDDHEIDNNWAAGLEQDGTPPEIFRLRRIMATQAYYEMMPLRKASFPVGETIRLYRRATFGTLLEMNFLDTRSYRSDQPCGDRWENYPCDAVSDPKATVLGDSQEKWLTDGLAASKTVWNSLAQQVMVSDFSRDAQADRINLDAWAGYKVPRERLLKFLKDRNLKNVVVLTGDEHQHYALEIKEKGGQSDSAVLATEFVATSITSGGDGRDMGRSGEPVLARNPHCKLYNGQRGYVVCDVTATRWQTEHKVLDKVTTPDGTLTTRATFAVDPKQPGLSAG